MTRLHIQPHDARTSYSPGQRIAGTIAWSLDAPTPTIELELRWQTDGRGVPDGETLASLRIDAPPLEGAREFQFSAPDSPYSFTGKLVTLRWLLVLKTADDSRAELELTLSPTAHAIDLYTIRP